MINRAPFEHLELDFNDENVVILSGINGAGKTTIISHIVDAFYELAKKAYSNEFEDKPTKFYRVSSSLYSINRSKPSIAYFRFQQDDSHNVDYIDITGTCDEKEYDAILALPERIPFSSIQSGLKRDGAIKHWSISDKKKIEECFSSNLLTYFPAYRYESPSYLNNPYEIKLSFKKEMDFAGYLPNPIEVTSDLPQIANWFMDVVLDRYIYPSDKSCLILQYQINDIISNILHSKVNCNTRLGFGPRLVGATRIAIMKRDVDEQVYPSIFNMSSGELSLLCLFGELAKQSDKIQRLCIEVTGIVLVDEIDKHLHVRLQKEVLPRLISMFPKLQFIVTSHSPFLGLGLADSNNLSYQIFDLNNGGLPCPPQDNELYREVYNTMIVENNRYYNQYKALRSEVQKNSKPLIITEGKTDWKHLKAAMKALNIDDLDIEYHEFEDDLGDKHLMSLLKDYSRVKLQRRVIGIFDRDNLSEKEIIKGLPGLGDQEYLELGNDVFAFSIPAVNTSEYGEQISIEHYYKREHLTKCDKDGRRLFLGDEFHKSGNSKDGKYHTKVSIDKKIRVNGVIDEKVYDRANDLEEEHSVALSKNAFAEYILNGNEFAQEFDFSSFNSIFEVIRKILAHGTEGSEK